MNDAATAARHAHWSVWQIIDDMDRRLEETGGEVTPDVEALEALSDEEARYAIAQWIAAAKEYGSREAQANAMFQHYRDAGRRDAALKQRCKERIGELLVLLGDRRASTPFGTAYFQKGRTSVEVEDDASLLDMLVDMGLATVQTTPDKKAIAERLVAGHEIAGCSLVQGAESLVIK